MQVLTAAAGRELQADLDGAVSALVSPLFSRRVVLAQLVGAQDADDVVSRFLRAYRT